MSAIAFNKIGFHGGPAGNHNGIGEYMRRLDEAGIPFTMKSADHYGHCYEAAQYSNAEHMVVFRLSTKGINDGFDYDVPRYDLPPQSAAQIHWQKTVTKLPPEFDKRKVWLEVINEVDKGRADWLGEFAWEIGRIGNTAGYKLLLFGWSAGEPEQTDWTLPGMLKFLRLCGERPDRLGVALHEYSYDKNNIWRLAGNLIGRYEQMFEVCDAYNIPEPTTVITEWGWEYQNVPDVAQAMQDIAGVAKLYAQSPALKGAATWYLGGGAEWGDIHNQTQRLIQPVTEYSLAARFAVDPVDPPSPPPPPAPEPPPLPPTPPPIAPPYAPEVTHAVLHPRTLNATQRAFLAGLMRDGREGVVPGFAGWAHTTAINAVATAVAGGFPASRLWVMDGEQIGTGLDAAWMQANQPAMVSYTKFISSGNPPPPPPPPPVGDVIDIPALSQLDPRWKDKPVGHGPKTIGQWGCLLTAYQMLATHWGINHGRDLVAENAYYLRQEAFSGHSLISMAMGKAYPDVVGHEGWLPRTDSRMHTRTRAYLAAGRPVCARVDFRPETPQWEQHWVLLVGHDGTDYLMNDPWGGRQAVRVSAHYGIAGSDVLECLYYYRKAEPLPPAPEPPVGKAAFGLHADARGGDLTPAEVSVFGAARTEMVKVLSSTSPASIHALSRVLGPVRWVVRAFLKFDNGRVVTPQQFFDWTIDDVTRTLNAIPQGDDVVVELHNEPNLVDEGLGGSWANGAAFNAWYTAVLALYRQRLGGVRYIFPGLSPGGDIAGVRQAHWPFMEACAGAIAASDGLGVHSYWAPNHGYPLYGNGLSGVTLVQAFCDRYPGKQIWVTEASNNREGTTLQRRAIEYIEFWEGCRRLPQVQGVMYFVASAAQGDFPHETWLVNDRSTGLAELVGAR